MGESTPLAPDVSVVVPTLGRALLEGCLESIAAGTMWPTELILVDQGANMEVDRWIDRLRARGLGVTHLRSPQRGIAAATNRGLERVRTPYVATTHDDCRVGADWLARVSSTVAAMGDAILTGRVEPDGDGLVLTVVTSSKPARYTRPMIDRDVLFPPNMAFPIHLLDRIGYFDEHPSLLLAGEDNDWAYRALKAGVPIVYDPGPVVRHLGWRNHDDLAATYRLYARGQGSFYGKHLRRGDLFIARRALYGLLRAPWLLAKGALSRNRDLLAMGIGEITGLPVGLFSGLWNSGAGERPTGNRFARQRGDEGVRTRRGLLRLLNRLLHALNLQLNKVGPPPRPPFDRDFLKWIRKAEATGRDPNDIGDEQWGEDLLEEGLLEHYLPLTAPDATILEVGPGTGRLTRHLIGRCRLLILVDSSPLVCEWISGYLSGKGRYRVHRIDGPLLPMVGDGEVDAVFAHGVVEHLDLEELYWFLVEFYRALRPGGAVVFNFDNVMSDRGIEVMKQEGPGRRALFRVHHPDSIRRVAEVVGFSDIRVVCRPGRIGFAKFIKGRP